MVQCLQCAQVDQYNALCMCSVYVCMFPPPKYVCLRLRNEPPDFDGMSLHLLGNFVCLPTGSTPRNAVGTGVEANKKADKKIK